MTHVEENINLPAMHWFFFPDNFLCMARKNILAHFLQQRGHLYYYFYMPIGYTIIIIIKMDNITDTKNVFYLDLGHTDWARRFIYNCLSWAIRVNHFSLCNEWNISSSSVKGSSLLEMPQGAGWDMLSSFPLKVMFSKYASFAKQTEIYGEKTHLGLPLGYLLKSFQAGLIHLPVSTTSSGLWRSKKRWLNGLKRLGILIS